MLQRHTQKVRYSRQIILPEIGEVGQGILLNSKILVIGAGGLGSPCLLYLASSGVGEIGIIDFDEVEIHNLQRQIIHETSDIGRNKTLSAKDALNDLNPDIKINTYTEKLTGKNFEELFLNYDLIIDGSDNYETRFLINDYCHKLKKPLVTAAILGFEGQVIAFKSHLENQPCYRCIYPDLPPEGTMPNCSLNGIFAPTAGVAGSLQASLALKILLGIDEKNLTKNMIIFNLKDSSFRKVKISKDNKCSICN